MRFIHCIILASVIALLGLSTHSTAHSQTRDSIIHPYHVNYWATGGIILVGIGAEKLGVPWISDKKPISKAEILALDRNVINTFDRWALDFDASNMKYYVNQSDNVLTAILVLPGLTMLDRGARSDWVDILLLYAETQIITNNVYMYAPFGPTFQNRLRPVVYYDQFTDTDVRTRGANRNSFYSGHVANSASASFFTAKVLCDYHPEWGFTKYAVYAAAAVPPLILSYFRLRALSHFPSDIAVGIGVGALVGILVPELHRITIDHASLALYSSFEGTGLGLLWHPGF